MNLKEISVADELNQALRIPTTHTLVKGIAGPANSGMRKVFFFRTIKEPQTHIASFLPLRL